jgi:O-antigen ligase
MAKKKRYSSDRTSGNPNSDAAASNGAVDAAADRPKRNGNGSGNGNGGSTAMLALPYEVTRGDWTVLILALMMFFAPALGVPHEEMLQDTLKSIVVSFGALGAALLFFWQQRNRRDGLRWHGLMWLPLALMAYALGSMVWSHTYLGGVEAIRWFIFSVLLWLGINTLARDRVSMLAWGIHWGAVVASLWVALQFWVDFTYFPQGPNPASTFVNRNFVAEFVVCTLPFSVLLLARAKSTPNILILAVTLGLNVVGIMMTGTRSALTAMLLITLILPVILYLYRAQFSFAQWDAGRRIIAGGMLFATIAGLGMIQTGNPKLIEEHRVEQRGLTGLQRGFARALSMTKTEEYTEKSFSVRLIMWKATARIIQAHPLRGVGAGAWEVDIPLYQVEGSQLETDYYVHNEILQLLAEYGLVGWLFLILLLSYLLFSAWRTLRDKSAEGQSEAPLRALALTSLLAFLVVSNAGFPWRMASTGAIFALALAILAASDARLGLRGPALARRLAWTPAYSQGMAMAMMVFTALAAYITQQAAECESKIVKATKIALTISASNDYQNPKWDKPKADMLRLIKEGTDINPHYRKITPMVADELAKWGDWKNATWIWETVISSRPYVVAIMSNVARGFASTGQPEEALKYLARAKKIQPKATSVRSLEVVLLSRTGKEAEALKLAREAIESEVYDYDLVHAAFILGWRASDYPFAIKAMDLRIKGWPATRAGGLLQLGNMYTTGDIKPAKALATFKELMDMTPEPERRALLAQIPPVHWAKLGYPNVVAVQGTQTSAISK